MLIKVKTRILGFYSTVENEELGDFIGGKIIIQHKKKGPVSGIASFASATGAEEELGIGKEQASTKSLLWNLYCLADKVKRIQSYKS
ncbi:MAG: hypothetical protein ACJ75B_18825 [Flavisolibacter sp.]